MRKRVLLFESQDIFRTGLDIALKREGMELVKESNPEIDSILSSPEVNGRVDLLILSIPIGDYAGLSIFEYLANKKPEIPVVVLVDSIDYDSRIFSTNCKNINVIRKPFKHNVLISEITRLLNKRDKESV